jgi:plastocyanin domain-containing protein
MRHAFLVVIAATASVALAETPAPKRIEIRVTESGFEPQQLTLKKGEPVTLVFTRTTDATCITAIDIPDEKVKDLDLPLGKAVTVTVIPKKAGVEPFHCSAMAMGDGKLVVSD